MPPSGFSCDRRNSENAPTCCPFGLLRSAFLTQLEIAPDTVTISLSSHSQLIRPDLIITNDWEGILDGPVTWTMITTLQEPVWTICQNDLFEHF
ncbi:hypothetical protein PHMEG_00036164 [Phytophthora megakarya]|uniref:Uncharacterized protein n=1 Tax=Phytophthora megakarya TaxID=4795 RepID=A0A225UML0_9STRA|nr:hypothetical protein PHMEG_00036164 [Phytophthora megakarya]